MKVGGLLSYRPLAAKINWENPENAEFEDFDKKVFKIVSKLWKCGANDSSLLLMPAMRMMMRRMKVKKLYLFCVFIA